MFLLSRLQLLPRSPFIDTFQEPLVIMGMKLLKDFFLLSPFLIGVSLLKSDAIHNWLELTSQCRATVLHRLKGFYGGVRFCWSVTMSMRPEIFLVHTCFLLSSLGFYFYFIFLFSPLPLIFLFSGTMSSIALLSKHGKSCGTLALGYLSGLFLSGQIFSLRRYKLIPKVRFLQKWALG